MRAPQMDYALNTKRASKLLPLKPLNASLNTALIHSRIPSGSPFHCTRINRVPSSRCVHTAPHVSSYAASVYIPTTGLDPSVLNNDLPDVLDANRSNKAHFMELIRLLGSTAILAVAVNVQPVLFSATMLSNIIHLKPIIGGVLLLKQQDSHDPSELELVYQPDNIHLPECVVKPEIFISRANFVRGDSQFTIDNRPDLGIVAQGNLVYAGNPLANIIAFPIFPLCFSAGPANCVAGIYPIALLRTDRLTEACKYFLAHRAACSAGFIECTRAFFKDSIEQLHGLFDRETYRDGPGISFPDPF